MEQKIIKAVFNSIMTLNDNSVIETLKFIEDLKSMAFKELEIIDRKLALQNVKQMTYNEYLSLFTKKRVNSIQSIAQEKEFYIIMESFSDDLWDYCVDDFEEAMNSTNSTYDNMKLVLLPNGRLWELPQSCGYSIRK